MTAANPADTATVDASIVGVLERHARLVRPVTEIGDDDILYQLGMTSHASVDVMLALEDEFDLEFPDRMLNRSVFSTIANIRAAIIELLVSQP